MRDCMDMVYVLLNALDGCIATCPHQQCIQEVVGPRIINFPPPHAILKSPNWQNRVFKMFANVLKMQLSCLHKYLDP